VAIYGLPASTNSGFSVIDAIVETSGRVAVTTIKKKNGDYRKVTTEFDSVFERETLEGMEIDLKYNRVQ
jgi:hypothetical protein